LLDGYGYVWCDTKAIANVVSLDNAEKPGYFDTSHKAKQCFAMSNKFSFYKDKNALHVRPFIQIRLKIVK